MRVLGFCLSSLAVHTLGFRIASEPGPQPLQPTDDAEEAAQQIGLHASDLSAPADTRGHRDNYTIDTHDAVLPWGNDMYAVKAEDVRAWLSNRSHWLQGELSRHPRYSEFPIKGVGAFYNMGPSALLDATHFSNWDPDLNTFDINMNWVTMQSGVPPAQPDGSGGPFIAGSVMMRGARSQNYWNKFICPPRPMVDGDNCTVIGSFFGLPYWMDVEGSLGNAALKIFKEDGGKVWRRHSWIRAPWRRGIFGSNDDTWQTENDPWHSYDLLQIMDENYVINEENLATFIARLDGQEILGWADYFK